ncbi:MAG: glycosyltransferase family 2 protein [Thermodesulfovibrio sp.]|nr:glycosyltransferase family 2 protein [Thermodesulfovibrio sp.]
MRTLQETMQTSTTKPSGAIGVALAGEDRFQAGIPQHTVTVIIPCRNEEKYIGKFIATLAGQNYFDGLPHEKTEVLFVDGESTDRTREIIEQQTRDHPFMRVLSNPQRIVPEAMNIGIRQAKGDVIIRMDAHTEYPPDYITNCVECLDRTGAENVGGPIISISDTFCGKAIAAGMSSVFGVGNSRFRLGGFEGYVDTVPFGAYRRDVFDRIGLFDTELVRNQDDELNYRLIKNGGKIFMGSGIKSYYYPRDSIGKLWKQYYEYGYWKVRVIRKHGLPASWRHLVPVTFVLSILLTGLLALFEPRAAYLFSAIAGSYALLAVFFSIRIAAEKGIRYLPVLPIVFATLHVSYGFGFLKGIWDFIVVKRHRKIAPQQRDGLDMSGTGRDV